MREFTYDALPGRVLFATGALDRAAAEIDALSIQRILVIADRSAQRWADELSAALGARVVGRIDDVRVHVPVEDAEAARSLTTETGADGILTIGGGSATGLGKAVALTNDVILVAIPTTYAGSEMTPIWGLTEGAHKKTGRDLRVQPRLVIYDPRLTYSLPPSVAGPSGINALAHCAEALYAPSANPITSLMAEEGIRILANSLPRIVATPEDADARSEALMGSYLAGASFAAAGSGIHHKICHVIGGRWDLPHAETHTVVLPHALAFNAPAVPDAMARMAGALASPDVPAAVYDLAVALGCPTSLATIGFPADGIDEAADLIVAAAPVNPRRVTRDAMAQLLTDAYEGRRPSRSESPTNPTFTRGHQVASGESVR